MRITSIKHMEKMVYKEKLYYVYRKVGIDMIKDGFINDVKELWDCDLVLKTKNQEDELLIFLIEIPDAVIVED